VVEGDDKIILHCSWCFFM